MFADQTPPVVTVTPTILDGTVVRWYRDLEAAERGDEMISASRNGVRQYLDDVPTAVLDQATRAHTVLRDRLPDDEVYALATHRHRVLFGDLEPIEREDHADA